MLNNFTDEKPRVVTEKNLKGRWHRGFRGCIGLPNILVCENCDGEDVLDKWKAIHDRWKKLRKKYWVFVDSK